MIGRMLDTVDYEAAIATTAEDMLTDCVPGSQIATEYALVSRLPDPEDYDPRGKDGLDPDFHAFVRWKAKERVDEEMDRISHECVVEDGLVVLWRELVVDADWIDGAFRDRPIGICWSWDRNFAVAHYGTDIGKPGRVKALVKALCEPDAVDWQMTVTLNAAAHYTVGDEKEIRLHHDRMIEIETIMTHEGRFAEVTPSREVHWPGRLLTAEPRPDFGPGPAP